MIVSGGVLTWRSWGESRKTDRSGSSRIYFEVRQKLRESFFISAVTRTAYVTGQNAMFSCSGGLTARKGKDGLSKNRCGVKWVKAYQTLGLGTWESGIYALDHNPHLIFTEVLTGEAQLCVAWRSSMFCIRSVRLTPRTSII